MAASRDATYSRTFLHRNILSNFSERWRSASADILIPSTGWHCQICCGLLGRLFMVRSSLLELASQHDLDAVNLGGHVAGREAGNLSNRSGVEALEVGEDYVPVQRFQALN